MPARLLRAGLLVGLTMIVGACGQSSPTPPIATPDSPQANPVSLASRWHRPGPQGGGQSRGPIARVGAALSLTGRGASVGQMQRNAIKLAQDEINNSHMLGNTRLEVIIEDDASDREQAAGIFQRFIESSHVTAILGPTLSDVALAVDPIAQQAGTPVVAVSNPAGGITEIGDFIFRVCLPEAKLNPHTVEVVETRLGVHRAALLSSDTDAQRAGSRSFEIALQDRQVQIVSTESFTHDQTDVRPELLDIVAAQPDALFISAPPQLAPGILIQARQVGLKSLPIVGGNSYNSDVVLKGAGDAADGLIIGSGWSGARPDTRNRQFIDAYRGRNGGNDPDQFAAQAYTGVYVIAEALKAAGASTDAHVLRNALASVKDLDTPLGKFSFDESREPELPAYVQIVRNGRLEPF